MKRLQRFLVLFILLTILMVTPALAAPGDTTRVSIDSSGTQGNSHSNFPSISADGRYVAFEAHASLVAGDTNGWEDIFVHDRTTGVTTRVSVSSSGIQANEASGWSSISADGRYVAFWSFASNLVPGDTNGSYDMFVHDRTTHVTTRVSVDSSGGQGNDFSSGGNISPDGRYVVFSSNATNLVAGDTNGVPDVFVHDRTTGLISRVSIATGGGQANGASDTPSNSAISAGGRYVAFRSDASNLVSGDTNGERDIFVHDRATGATTRISVSSSGGQGNGDSWHLAISTDGRYVAFASYANNLVIGDTNGARDIFVHDRTTGTTTRVSIDSTGGQASNNSYTSAPSISADGRFVAFSSLAPNLVPGDTNNQPDIFVHDRLTGITTRVSIASIGGQGNSNSDYPSISADGRFVAFHSWASNLVAGDTNGQVDVFVHELGATLPTDPEVLPKTGFAPGKVTLLPPQTVFYADLGNLWLEVPRLGVKMPIVGVPKQDNEWNVSWLGSNAGWLEGSAYPSWKGNSVLTGHVWNANNSPGPFLNLGTLLWGDRVIVHLSGQQYMYEVRTVKQVASMNVNAMMKHEDLSWLTLLTCKGYDEKTDSYRYRILVRAVLVEVK